MTDDSYRFSVQVHGEGGVLASAPASIAPCVEDALFRRLLSGKTANDGSLPPFRALPLWAKAGPPNVDGIRLVAEDEAPDDYGLDVFAPAARALIAGLLARKVVQDGDRVVWRVVGAPPCEAPRRFRGRSSRGPYPFRAAPLAHLAPGAFEVSIEAAVLDAVRRRFVDNLACERAGFLTGRLLHDGERGAAALVVGGQLEVAAGRGGSSGAHFSFDPESFRRARRAIENERRAIIAGWWHTHPPCERCLERSDCAAETVFFSAEDREVHRSAFPLRHAVGLVAGKVRDASARDPGFRLYGWMQGAIVELPLQLAGAPGEAAPGRRLAV
jgi:proteasome lid subunit RPN8/RPN11